MEKIKKIGVVGAGIMGKGIANAIFRQGKHQVTLYDMDTSLAEKSCREIVDGARKSMNTDNISLAKTLKEVTDDADLIIEAIVENIDVKSVLFAELNQLAPKKTIFASNTSSLSISKMAAASERPDQFLGTHFFNPPVVMRLVEVILPPDLNREVVPLVNGFLGEIKKEAVLCKESPAFIVNRILIPIINEAFHLLQSVPDGFRIEFANQVDSAMVESGVLPMGPFELVDMTGIDTAYAVAQTIHEGLGPRYKPSLVMKEYVDAGHFGRKSLRGIYCYESSANDPDLNPCLDLNKNKVERLISGDFNALDLVAVIVNEAFRVMEEGLVDDFKSIDTCMELGTRWTDGPFALAKEFGLEKIHSFLSGKSEKRYRPSSLFTDLPQEIRSYLD